MCSEEEHPPPSTGSWWLSAVKKRAAPPVLTQTSWRSKRSCCPGQQDGRGGGDGAAGGHTRNSRLRGQPVGEPGSPAAPHGVCASGASGCIRLFIDFTTRGVLRSPPHASFSSQTKDVTAAMNQGKFEEAIKLRGTYVFSLEMSPDLHCGSPLAKGERRGSFCLCLYLCSFDFNKHKYGHNTASFTATELTLVWW